MATVKVLLRTSKLNHKGESPLYLRIIKDRRAKFISLGIFLLPKYWDKTEFRIRKSHPNATWANNFIAHKIAEAQSIALELETNSKYLSPKKIKEAVMGKSSESFLKFAERYIANMEQRGKIGTLDKAIVTFSKLKVYLGKRDLLFNEITLNWLKNYESYLRTHLGNSTNTIHSNIKIFRKLINDAIAEDIFPPEKNPFIRYKLKLEQVRKGFLTEEELVLIEALPLEKNSTKDHYRNMYLFAANTGGLRFSDIVQLRWKNFDGEKVLVQTKKTGSTVSIKLPNKALDILKQYKTNQSTENDFIFPFLKSDQDYSNPRDLFRSIASASTYSNVKLRAIAKAAGITKRLNFHTSRHTWATRALSKGMRIEYVSKLMGHTSIKTTQIYAKIVNAELDKAMEVFNL